MRSSIDENLRSHLGQSLFQILGNLIRAAGGTGAAGSALHTGDGVFCFHALEQAADAFQVAVAAANDLDGLNGVVVVQEQVPTLGKLNDLLIAKYPLFFKSTWLDPAMVSFTK